MNRVVKIICIVSVVFIIIGGMLTASAYFAGARFENYRYDGNWYYRNELTNEFHISLENTQSIKKLELDVSYGEVRIYTGEEFDVVIDNGYLDYFECDINGDTLRVEYDTEDHSFRWSRNHPPTINITIPRDFIFEKADLSLGAGVLYSAWIYADTISVEVGAGSVTIDSLLARNASVQCGVGEARIAADISNYCSLDCATGEIDVRLAGSSKDWDFNADIGVGQVQINGSDFSGWGSRSNHNTGAEKKIDVQCGVGSIILNFEENAQ